MKGYDLVILGSGTTAFAGALKASSYGARVLMVEQSRLGGTCVNWGCIPSKTLIDKAEQHFSARRKEKIGCEQPSPSPDFDRLMSAKRKAVETLREEKYQKVLEAHPEIEILRGHGAFLSPRELQVGAEIIHCERFLIASGGYPRTLRLPGLDQIEYLTSYSALNLKRFPDSLLILGGGVIALEMGQMFNRFGTRVTIVERGRRPIKDFDPRLTDIFLRQAELEGMQFFFGAEALRVSRDGNACSLEARISGKEIRLQAERLMLAIGTAPATDGIGLEAAGVRTDEGGFIVTDDEMRTTAAGLWAAGDVTGPPLIAPAGAWEAEVAVANMFEPLAHCRIDHFATPLAVFTDPEFAMVGQCPALSSTSCDKVVETFLPLAEVAKSHVIDRKEGGILLWAEHPGGKVLAVQILAPRAADIIHEAILAVRCGLTVEDLAQTQHVYPTLSDGLRLAALENIVSARRRQVSIA